MIPFEKVRSNLVEVRDVLTKDCSQVLFTDALRIDFTRVRPCYHECIGGHNQTNA